MKIVFEAYSCYLMYNREEVKAKISDLCFCWFKLSEFIGINKGRMEEQEDLNRLGWKEQLVKDT